MEGFGSSLAASSPRPSADEGELGARVRVERGDGDTGAVGARAERQLGEQVGGKRGECEVEGNKEEEDERGCEPETCIYSGQVFSRSGR